MCLFECLHKCPAFYALSTLTISNLRQGHQFSVHFYVRFHVWSSGRAFHGNTSFQGQMKPAIFLKLDKIPKRLGS